MKLIDDDAWSMTVYLARQIKNEQGDVIDGAELWENIENCCRIIR